MTLPRRISFELRDDDGVLQSGVDLSGTGVIKVSVNGAASTNRSGSAPTSIGSDGAYYYEWSAGELAAGAGGCLVLQIVAPSGYQSFNLREDIEGAVALPRRVTFELRDLDGNLASGVDLSGAGVIGVSVNGAAAVARVGAAPTSFGNGSYYYQWDPAELEAAESGWLLMMLTAPTGYQSFSIRDDIASADGGSIEITAVSPALDAAPGSPGAFPANYQIAKKIPIVIDVTDAGGVIEYLAVTVRYTPDDPESTAYRDGLLRTGFVLNSSVTAVSGGVELTLLPDDFWTSVPTGPGYIIADIDAIDSTGSASSTEFIWQLPASTPAVIEVPAVPLGVIDHIAVALSRVRQQFRDLSELVRTPPLGPTARFTFANGDGGVEFSDTSEWSTAPIVSWSWAFGDGGTSTEENPEHAYAMTGVYGVTLTTVDANGASDTFAKPIQLTASAPTAWLLKSPATSPSARYSAPGAFVPSLGFVIIGGTTDGSTAIDDAWLWNGVTWATFPSPPSGYAGFGGGLGYDSDRNVLVWVPAFDSAYILNYAEFDIATSTWSTFTSTGLSDSVWSSIAYDKNRKKMVFFSGFGSGTAIFELDATTHVWALTTPSHIPSGNYGVAFVYDEIRERIVSYGGQNSAIDTQTYDGTDWTSPLSDPVHTPTAASAEAGFLAIAFNPSRGKSTMKTDAQTWEWDGTDWSQLTLTNQAYTAAATFPKSSICYDTTRHEIVLFGGLNPSLNNDTWTLTDGLVVA